MKIETLPLDQIKESDLNPRRTKASLQDAKELAASIKAIGMHQPPTVRKNCDGYEITAGNRRIAAARSLGWTEIDVIVQDEGEHNEVWAIAENMVRTPLEPMDQFEAFRKLADQGRTTSEIADLFGIKSQLVNQRMALGNLHPKVRSAYRKDLIDMDACMAFTLTDPKTQLKLLNDNVCSSWQIHNAITNDYIDMKYAEFNPSEYTGEIVTDLFGDETFAVDRAQFIELQIKWIDAEIKKALTQRNKPLFACRVDTPPEYSGKIKLESGTYKLERYGNIPAKERKKYGMIWFIDTYGKVHLRDGFAPVGKPKEKETIDPETGEITSVNAIDDHDPAKLTVKQHEIYAGIVKYAFLQQATLDDVLHFLIRKRGMTGHPKKIPTTPKDKLTALKHIVLDYADNKVADRDLMDTIAGSKIDIAKDVIWTEEFLKPYSQSQLECIAANVDKDLSKSVAMSKKKSDKVEYLVAGLKKADGWVPFAPASDANEKVQIAAAKKRYL